MLPKGLKSKLQHIYDVLEANNHLLNQLVADREKKLSKIL